MIQDLWNEQAEYDADSYKYDPMAAFLYQREKIKNYKHGKHFHNQRKHFSLFVLYIDDMLGRETLVVFVQLSLIMAAKMDKTISHVRGWINGKIKIEFERLYPRMIRGA